MSQLAAVDLTDFQSGNKLMEEAFAIEPGDQFERAKKSISRYCYARFNVSEEHLETERALQANALAETLVFRLLFYAKFIREYWPLLVRRNLMRGNLQHEMIEEVAAYLPLSGDIDPEQMLAEVDRRLGRKHIPVTAQELAEIDQDLEDITSDLIAEDLEADDELDDDEELDVPQDGKSHVLGIEAFGSLAGAFHEESELPLPIRREERKIGRNEPCYCGSGKKYKRCHGETREGA